ncbi:MAG: ComF family protein [Azospirillaceae bacterium]
MPGTAAPAPAGSGFTVAAAAAWLAGRLLDAVLPPRCLVSGAPVDRAGTVAPPVWGTLTFLAPPWCVRCGLPFDFDAGEAALCGACAGRAPPFDRARAVLAYDEACRPLLLAFKHGDRTDAAGPLAAWMARAGAPLLADADVVVPVPLHRRRLFRRRYNQAALLAAALGRAGGVAVVPDALARQRRTRSQGGLGRAGRRRNLSGAIVARPARRVAIAGCRVLLVDDVMTTGATVEACARALRRGGASAVDVLTLARVVGLPGWQ